MRQRLEELGYGKPLVEEENRNQIRVEVPGVYDAQLLKDILSVRGNFSFRAVDSTMSPDDAIRGTPPADSEIIYSYDDPPVGYLVKKQPILTGANVTDAKATLTDNDTEPVITLMLDDAGRKSLAEATSHLVGGSFAIVVDNQIVSAPAVDEKLDTDELQISGAFDLQAANNMAVVLRSARCRRMLRFWKSARSHRLWVRTMPALPHWQHCLRCCLSACSWSCHTASLA